MVANVSKKRMRTILFWAQEGRCYLCQKQMPHPEDWSNPLIAVTIDHVRCKEGGFGWRKNALVAHFICNNRKANRDPTESEILFLAFVNSKIKRFRAWSWAEIEAFLRVQPCFLRFALKAELRGQENPHADHERATSGCQVPPESQC